MDELVLHIGAPKTGSSTLQKTLASNWQALQHKHRIGYSHSGEGLMRYALGETRHLRLPPFKDTLVEVERAIYSYEKMFLKILVEQHTRHLVEALDTHFKRVSVLCYLRRQDEMFVSSYSTSILAGNRKRFSDIPRNGVMFIDRLRAWEAALRPGCLHLHRFGQAYFEIDFISDFLEALGIPESTIAKRRVVNVSPTLEVMELQRLVNIPLQNDPDRRSIVKLLNNIDLPGRPIGLGRKEREAILAECEEDNRAVARRYFGRNTLFDHPIADDPSPEVTLAPRDVEALTRRALEKIGVEPDRPPANRADMNDMLDWCIEMLKSAHAYLVSKPVKWNIPGKYADDP